MVVCCLLVFSVVGGGQGGGGGADMISSFQARNVWPADDGLLLPRV